MKANNVISTNFKNNKRDTSTFKGLYISLREAHLLELIRSSPEIESVLKICGEVDAGTRARIFALVFKAINKDRKTGGSA